MMKHAIKSILTFLALGTATVSPVDISPAAADDQIGEVRHSAWLALRIEQGGEFAPLRYTGDKRTEVTLNKRSFTIVFPVRSEEDTYHLTAWDDASIFGKADEAKRKNWADRSSQVLPAFFGPATGMADTAASQGDLFLNDEAHHHLTGLRLGPDKGRPIFHVSSVSKWTEDRTRIQTAIKDIKHPLYLVAWYDENGDDKMSHGEYEFLVLRFK